MVFIFQKVPKSFFTTRPPVYPFALCTGTVLLLGNNSGLTDLVTWGGRKELHHNKKSLYGQNTGNDTWIQAQTQKKETTEEPVATSQLVEDNSLQDGS